MRAKLATPTHFVDKLKRSLSLKKKSWNDKKAPLKMYSYSENEASTIFKLAK